MLGIFFKTISGIIILVVVVVVAMFWTKTTPSSPSTPKNPNYYPKEEETWFAEGKWLSDEEINWVIDVVLPEEIVNSPSITYAADATLAHAYLENINNPSSQDILAGMLSYCTDLNNKLVFWPINQPNCHWSLLVYEQASKKLFHFDTLNGLNDRYVRPLAKKMLQNLHSNNSVNLEQYFIPKHEIKQNNGYDCGIGVISIIKWLAQNYESDLTNMPIPSFNFASDRQAWRKKYCEGLSDSDSDEEETNDNQSPLSPKKPDQPPTNPQTNNLKNIILFGESQSGKSTLANVLLNKNGDFTNVFGEKDRTTDILQQQFFSNKKTYTIFDTPNLETITPVSLVWKLANLGCKIEDSQIILVINEPSSAKNLATCERLKKYLPLEKEIIVVRTNFKEFLNKSAVAADLANENPELLKIVPQENFIYMDNLPLEKNLSKMSRQASRDELLVKLGI